MTASLPSQVAAAALVLLDELQPAAHNERAVVLEVSCSGPHLAAAVAAAGYDHLAPWASVGAVAEGAAVRVPGTQLPELHSGAHAATITEALDGRTVAAVVVVDLFAAGPGADPAWLLASLHTLIVELGGPPMIVVEENPTHIDVVADLLTGRPRSGRAGRVGAPGVFGVGAAQLESTLAAAGFTSLRRQDVSSPSVTPYDPDLHAAASSFTPLGQLLRRVRAGADEFGFVTDFVRAYAPTARRPAPRELPLPSCFLSVIVRNQGGRCQHLLEALTCLAAQTVDDLEVLVMVHDGHPDAIDRVEALVDLFDEAFAARISVIGVKGGRRSEPWVRGLAAAGGAYAAFLDDDDHVTGHWVEAFRDGAIAAPGNVIRSRCGEQHHRDVTAPDAPAEWEATSAFSVTFANDWDLVEHLDTNRTPHHSFAVPLATVRHLGVTVDGDTPVLEDWGLLLRMAELCGVHDTGEVTAISQRWAAADRSRVASTPEVWTASRTLLLDDLAAAPFVLPRGGVRRVVDADAQRAELDSLRDALASERGRAELAEAEAELAGAEAAQLAFRVRQFEQSEWWRMTGPMRHGIDRLRRRGR